jgi:hypothetical protein
MVMMVALHAVGRTRKLLLCVGVALEDLPWPSGITVA